MDISFSKVAEKSGYSRTYVGRVLKGERDCSLKCAIALAQAMEITLDELVKYIDDERKATAIEPNPLVEKYPDILKIRLYPIYRGDT